MTTYTPKSEEQLIREGLIPDGIYDYEVVETDDTPSKKKNPMFTLKLHVYDQDANPRVITDYIALGSNFGERKLRHAADGSGIIDIYNSGELVHTDFLGRSGKVSIKTQEGSKEYPDPKNVVHDYIKREEQSPAKTKTVSVDDDEVPF